MIKVSKLAVLVLVLAGCSRGTSPAPDAGDDASDASDEDGGCVSPDACEGLPGILDAASSPPACPPLLRHHHAAHAPHLRLVVRLLRGLHDGVRGQVVEQGASHRLEPASCSGSGSTSPGEISRMGSAHAPRPIAWGVGPGVGTRDLVLARPGRSPLRPARCAPGCRRPRAPPAGRGRPPTAGRARRDRRRCGPARRPRAFLRARGRRSEPGRALPWRATRTRRPRARPGGARQHLADRRDGPRRQVDAARRGRAGGRRRLRGATISDASRRRRSW